MALIVYQIGSKKMENGAASALYFFVLFASLSIMKHAITAIHFPLISLDRRQIASAAVSGILLQTA